MVGREPSRRPHDNTPPRSHVFVVFHYVKWHNAGSDPTTALLKQDGDRPGKNALKYITYWFPQSYAISLAWPRLRN
jgi:hypothetical protein